MKISTKARKYATKCHTETNHLYDGQPYIMHPGDVVGVAERYIHLLDNDEDRENARAGCWCHDVIEDCRQTYNDVKTATNETVADIVYAVSNEKGKTRRERANSKYYKGIREIQLALFTKLCDRIANIEYGIASGSNMLSMYRKENAYFNIQLYEFNFENALQFDIMFQKIKSLLEI